MKERRSGLAADIGAKERYSEWKTCLVVDDSKVVRTIARRILEGIEFKVDEAADGQQAVDACKAAMPDAVLLDWKHAGHERA